MCFCAVYLGSLRIAKLPGHCKISIIPFAGHDILRKNQAGHIIFRTRVRRVSLSGVSLFSRKQWGTSEGGSNESGHQRGIDVQQDVCAAALPTSEPPTLTRHQTSPRVPAPETNDSGDEASKGRSERWDVRSDLVLRGQSAETLRIASCVRKALQESNPQSTRQLKTPTHATVDDVEQGLDAAQELADLLMPAEAVISDRTPPPVPAVYSPERMAVRTCGGRDYDSAYRDADRGPHVTPRASRDRQLHDRKWIACGDPFPNQGWSHGMANCGRQERGWKKAGADCVERVGSKSSAWQVETGRDPVRYHWPSTPVSRFLGVEWNR